MIDSDQKSPISPLPLKLAEKIEALERQWDQGEVVVKGERKIAAFDLDDTLLKGDIGEAVFARLKLDEKNGTLAAPQKVIPFSWSQYRRLLENNRKREAYTRVVTAMSGIPTAVVVETTRRVMASTEAYLPLEGDRIPLPSPHPVMFSLLQRLKALDYEIYIISASNHYSVVTAGEDFLGIPAANAFGIKSEIDYIRPSSAEEGEKIPVLTAELEEPLSFDEGKVEVYRQRVGSTPPLLTAGDSRTDISFLNLTHPSGLTIWVGDSREEFREVREKILHPGILFFLNRRNS